MDNLANMIVAAFALIGIAFVVGVIADVRGDQPRDK